MRPWLVIEAGIGMRTTISSMGLPSVGRAPRVTLMWPTPPDAASSLSAGSAAAAALPPADAGGGGGTPGADALAAGGAEKEMTELT